MDARNIRVSGMVQGVGFRWTTKRIADSLGLSGWVKNNDDGSVSIAVKGDAETVDRFIEELHDAMGHYIAGVQSAKAVPGKIRDGFDVVR